MIRKLQRKPIVVEALPWNGVDLDEVRDFTGQKNLYIEPNGQVWFTDTNGSSYGTHADKGDWIIKVNGHLSACHAEDLPFEYDLV